MQKAGQKSKKVGITHGGVQAFPDSVGRVAENERGAHHGQILRLGSRDEA